MNYSTQERKRVSFRSMVLGAERAIFGEGAAPLELGLAALAIQKVRGGKKSVITFCVSISCERRS